MKRILVLFILLFIGRAASAQKVENIYFHLYTDSLKKGFYNYINVDGKLSNGSWSPLDSNHVTFTCNTGFFKGNDLYIDSSYTADTVIVKAVLKSDPAIWKQTVIHIRKRGFDEPLKTNEQILNDMRKPKAKS